MIYYYNKLNIEWYIALLLDNLNISKTKTWNSRILVRVQ